MNSILGTIIAGVAVFVVGQAVQKFVLEPIQEFHKKRAATASLLLRWQAKITNASRDAEDLPDQIRELSAGLLSSCTAMPFYKFFSGLGVFGLPGREDVVKACRELNGIAYGVGERPHLPDQAIKNTQALSEIGRLLGFKADFS